MELELEIVKARIRDVPNFPSEGVVFKDITPLLGDEHVFAMCVEALAQAFSSLRVDKVLGIEARGFILAAPVALRLGAGFVPVRKAGKLPWRVEQECYTLEYGRDVLEIHADGLQPGERALIIDDVLATGGTASATARLVARLGAEAVGFGCLIELTFLHGRGKLGDLNAVSLVSY